MNDSRLKRVKRETVVSIAVASTACLNLVTIVDRAANDVRDLTARLGVCENHWSYRDIQVVKRDMQCKESLSSKGHQRRVVPHGCQKAVVAGDALDVSHRQDC
jgi:hypothetical protein